MMMTFITRGGEGREDKDKDRKATKSEEGLVARSCAGVVRKDVVGEFKCVDLT